MPLKKINTAVVGFGLSGKVFHAPFIHAHPGFNLSAILTSGEEAKRMYPQAKTSRKYEELLEDPDLNLIIICSPNGYHFEQAKKAFESGKDVILEKPMTATAREAQELTGIAIKHGRRLFPYQNRRWDGDFLTIRHILKEGYLGQVLDFETHFDRFNPDVSRAAWRYSDKAAAGTLYDLGVHLVDQVQVLFGKPEAVFCRLFNQRENSAADDSFDLKLIYPDLNVTVKAGVFVREQGLRFAIHGRAGSFVKYGLDPQEAALRKGGLPGSKDWGVEAKRWWGLLNTDFNGKKIRGKYETFPGNYMAFFDNVHEVLQKGGELVVKPEQVILNLNIIEKAIESNKKQAVIKL